MAGASSCRLCKTGLTIVSCVAGWAQAPITLNSSSGTAQPSLLAGFGRRQPAARRCLLIRNLNQRRDLFVNVSTARDSQLVRSLAGGHVEYDAAAFAPIGLDFPEQ